MIKRLLDAVKKVSEKMKGCAKNAGQNQFVKEEERGLKSVSGDCPFTRDPNQREYGKKYNIYDDSTDRWDDDD